MLFWIFRPVRILAKALLDQTSPRQLALGFAMGMVIGFVPKGNLLSVILMMTLSASRVNVGVGLAAAFVFSWIGALSDGVSHRVGFWLLTRPQLESVWTQAYNAPVLPWTDFNNTVVLGSFVLGLILFLPAYAASRPLFERYSEPVAERLKKYRVTKVLFTAEWTDRVGSV